MDGWVYGWRADKRWVDLSLQQRYERRNVAFKSSENCAMILGVCSSTLDKEASTKHLPVQAEPYRRGIYAVNTLLPTSLQSWPLRASAPSLTQLLLFCT